MKSLIQRDETRDSHISQSYILYSNVRQAKGYISSYIVHAWYAVLRYDGHFREKNRQKTRIRHFPDTKFFLARQSKTIGFH